MTGEIYQVVKLRKNVTSSGGAMTSYVLYQSTKSAQL